ncbi:MAG: hypothetical protein HN590_17185 [Calditrichaeota bacterium]|jgi:diacylglycerol kinase family enzyme|nr:hypothetical protein [Calditrichota bacterium]MBT7787742.1 hypothetical protein [Calditrichota bacterium]
MSNHIDVIATTISGSVSDWSKVKRIVPLFKEYGEEDVNLISVDSHKDARLRACEFLKAGSKIVISAGGSGTFNAVVEGCFDAGVDLSDVKIGFLRKGSADLIGKVLKMPDEISEAVRVFVDAIRANRTLPCDVLTAVSGEEGAIARRFVGYGGAELFGEIPYFTENRYMKYYKGILSQILGDLGPFFVGTNLAMIRRLFRYTFNKRQIWKIRVDGDEVSNGQFQAMVIVNGDLGPNLPFAQGVPLGSGDFHLFTFKYQGQLKIISQLRHAWDSSILSDPERWGFASHQINKTLEIIPADESEFPINVDGSTLICRKKASFEIMDRVHFLTG